MVNVVIPLYKSRQTLPNCLDSLVAQTKKMFLVTLVNDCDEEDYSDIIKEYKRRGLHINYIQLKKNYGPGYARQLGTDAIKMCDYVMYLDADDMLNPRAIEVLYTEAKKNGYDVLFSKQIMERPSAVGVLLDTMENVTWLHGKIYKMAYLEKINLRFLENQRDAEDVYFNAVACNATSNIGNLEEVTYIWRNNPNSVTRIDEDAYFLRTSTDFIRAEILSFEKLTSIIEEPTFGLLGGLIINLYRSMMVQLQYNILDKEYPLYKDLLNNFSKNKYVADFFSKRNGWLTLASLVRGANVYKKIVFCKQPLDEWILKYLGYNKLEDV